MAPVRLGNLASIRLDENLTKPDGPDSNYWLMFAKSTGQRITVYQFRHALVH